MGFKLPDRDELRGMAAEPGRPLDNTAFERAGDAS